MITHNMPLFYGPGIYNGIPKYYPSISGVLMSSQWPYQDQIFMDQKCLSH